MQFSNLKQLWHMSTKFFTAVQNHQLQTWEVHICLLPSPCLPWGRYQWQEAQNHRKVAVDPVCDTLVSNVQNYPAGKSDPCHLHLLSDHFHCDFWIPENKHGLAGRIALLSWRICRETSFIMWMPIISLISTLSAGLQPGYESCQVPASSNAFQLSLTWPSPPRASEVYRPKSFMSLLFKFLYMPQMQSSPRPQ